MTTWGYARVSTVDQNVTAQLDALRAAGVDEEHVVVDHASGARADRPGLARLMNELIPGDVIVVVKLDRLGRSLSHLVELVGELGERGVHLRSLGEAIDTTTSTGRLLFHIIGAVAEFERDLVRERTAAALLAARARGKQLGRPSQVNAHQWRMIHRMSAAGETQAAIAATTGLSRHVVGRILRDEIPSLRSRYGKAPADDGELPFYEAT